MTAAFVGTYAGKGGTGLVPLVHDGQGGWTAGPPIPSIRNASFAVASARHGHRYLVDEAAGTVDVYAADWHPLAQVRSGGEAPCHLALSPDERHLAVANYASGSVTLFPLGDTGLPGAGITLADRGHGPDPDRQRGPHAHWVGFTPAGALLTVDLGTDRILSRPLDDLHAPQTLYTAPPGSGPRHLAPHPTLPVAYLVSELAATLTVLRPDGATLRAESIRAITVEQTLGGAIALDAPHARLYVTTRGGDCIVTYALDTHGTPTRIGHISSIGRSPRHLLLHQNHLLAANEESGQVTIFRIGANGCPMPEAEVIAIPGAAFLMTA